MKNKELIKAWKNAESKIIAESPVVVNKDLMSQVTGGDSSGYICSISAECSSRGTRCDMNGRLIWKYIKRAVAGSQEAVPYEPLETLEPDFEKAEFQGIIN